MLRRERKYVNPQPQPKQTPTPMTKHNVRGKSNERIREIDEQIRALEAQIQELTLLREREYAKLFQVHGD